MDKDSFERALDTNFIDVQQIYPSADLINFAEWLEQRKDQVFRFWVYKKIFTPYEEAEKFEDESIYEDDYCKLGYIKEAMLLPDGDIFLGFKLLNSEKDEKYLEYYKLSEIRLAYSSKDVEELI